MSIHDHIEDIFSTQVASMFICGCAIFYRQNNYLQLLMRKLLKQQQQTPFITPVLDKCAEIEAMIDSDNYLDVHYTLHQVMPSE